MCDTDRFQIHTNFTGTAKKLYEFDLERLRDLETLQVLKRVFFEPAKLRPGESAEAVTAEAAARVAQMAFPAALRRPRWSCRRVLTDNAKCYAESKAFLALCREEGVRQGFTRPDTPKTNGKAERFIQTLKRRWAYRHAYRTSALRAASLRPWLVHYNHRRPHRSLGKRTPMDRLREPVNVLHRSHT